MKLKMCDIQIHRLVKRYFHFLYINCYNFVYKINKQPFQVDFHYFLNDLMLLTINVTCKISGSKARLLRYISEIVHTE